MGDQEQIEYEVLSDMMTIDFQSFWWKHHALIHGIQSIVFMPRPNGSILELGFDRELPALLLKLVGVSWSLVRESALQTRARSASPLGRAIAQYDDPCASAKIAPPAKIPGYVKCSGSIGSLGHPIFCNAPCKFIWRRCGCKDGDACDRCHLCRFTHQSATKGAGSGSHQRIMHMYMKSTHTKKKLPEATSWDTSAR